MNQEDTSLEWLVITPHESRDVMTNLLLEFAENVEIDGSPDLLTVTSIVSAGPLIQRVRIAARFEKKVVADIALRQMLAERGITLEIAPKMESKESGVEPLETQSYRDKRYFMLHLDPERKQLLAEITKHAPDDIRVVSRYLCLNGEKHVSIHQAARILNVSTGHITNVVGMILYLLDSPFEVSKDSLRRANALDNTVKRTRRKERDNSEFHERLSSLGLSPADLPQDIPDAFIEAFAKVKHEWGRSRLDESVVEPRERHILVQRYGLIDHQFRTLEEIGLELNLTKERIRQIERKAIRRFRTK